MTKLVPEIFPFKKISFIKLIELILKDAIKTSRKIFLFFFNNFFNYF